MLRTLGTRSTLPCLVKALVVLGLVGRLTHRVPALVAGFGPPLLA